MRGWTTSVGGWLLVAAMGAAAVTAALGQVLHATGPLPAFEVASVRPSQNPSPRGGQWRRQGERFTMRAVTLEEMVMFAYGLGNDHEVSGVPGWGRSQPYDIEGKLTDADTKATMAMSQDDWDEQMRLRMQRVLAERFGLQVSFEKKELPVYVVTVGKGGLKCSATKPGAPGLPVGEQPRFFSPIPPPPPPPPPSAGGQEMPRAQQMPMDWRIRGWPFWYIVRMLGTAPEAGGRVMVDRTGLSGSYDCDIQWAPAGSDAAGPSLFTAMQEQLGLKFTPGRESVETVNVLHAEQPSGN